MTITIRSLPEKEMPAASALVQGVFDLFEAPDYAPQGVEAFHSFTTPEAMAEQLRNEAIQAWGAYRKERLVGVLTARNTTHISLLFVDPAYHRQGIATSLFIHFCKFLAESGFADDPISVNSSPYAIGFYHRLGFLPTDSERTVESIRFTPMEYSR